MAKRNYPTGSANALINNLEGRDMEKVPAVNAAYDLLGFGIHTTKNATNAVAAGVPAKMEEIIKELKAVSARVLKNPEVPPTLPNWFNAFLLDYLKRQLTT